MSCGCGGRKTVTTPGDPLVIGDPNETTIQVKATVNYRQLRPGEMAWVNGDGVGAMIEAGVLVPG
jgi:hypothetical protein